MKSPHSIVKSISFTEKGSRCTAALNQYFFKVDPAANKLEIKQAVERLFNVHVTNVNTLRRKGKRKRERTMTYGTTTGFKRAIVTLKAGEKIESK